MNSERAPRCLVSASYRLSWDSRILEPVAPAGGVDAFFDGDEIGKYAAGPSLPRVLLNPAQPAIEFLDCHSSPVIVYTTSPPAARDGRVHSRKRWRLRAVLEHLRATHGIRRVGFTAGPALFREFVSASLLDELYLTWSPKIIGGGSADPVTGLAESFLPRGVEFDLVKLNRAGSECSAHYRPRS